MKRYLKLAIAGLAFGLAIGCANAYMRSPIDRAWVRAMAIAGVPETEWSKWPKPVVSIIYTPRYIPISRDEGNRLCGETMPAFEGPNPNSLKLVFYIAAYVRPTGEKQLLVDILTHEFLHVVWLERAMYNDEWHAAHPNSEQYVQGLLPNSCPNF